MNEAKKEGELRRESMNDILKQNNLLNEEVRVKADYITLIEETRKNQRENQSKQQNENKDDAEIEIVIEKETTTQATKSYADIINNGKNKHRCYECNYETKVKTHVRGHMLAHKGQYQCPRGCKVAFKTVAGLEEHLKTMHRVPQQVNGYTCIHCDIIFPAQFQLRQHMNKKHMKSTESKEYTCESCNLKFSSIDILSNHQESCHTDFTPVRAQICRFYMNGACTKGEFFSFLIAKQITQLWTLLCVEMVLYVDIWPKECAPSSIKV